MSAIRPLLMPAVLLLAACSRELPPVDPQLAAAIAGIKAIDNHAHPVLTAPGDREFDALPVAVYTRDQPLLEKPNAYLDFSGQSLALSPAALSGILREWLEHVPEKVMFATDGYPYSNEMGWEESGWMAAHNGREALGRALTAMRRDGTITHTRAVELARMVLRENARALYGF